MDKHHRFFHRSRLLSIVDKGLVVIIAESHPTDDHDVSIGLVRNPHEELIIGLPSNREDRNLLGLHQAVKNIDHWDVGVHHLVGNNSLHRVERGLVDVDLLPNHFRTVIDRLPRPIEAPS